MGFDKKSRSGVEGESRKLNFGKRSASPRIGLSLGVRKPGVRRTILIWKCILILLPRRPPKAGGNDLALGCHHKERDGTKRTLPEKAKSQAVRFETLEGRRDFCWGGSPLFSHCHCPKGWRKERNNDSATFPSFFENQGSIFFCIPWLVGPSLPACCPGEITLPRI